MVSSPNAKVRLATENDLPGLITFLKTPVIDNSFVYPLSQRTTSIEERVHTKFTRGFWVIAVHEGEIVGCRGCNGFSDLENKVVEFSTLAINPGFRGSGLGLALVRTATEIALARYEPRIMKFDSWATNKAVERIALSLGFQKARIYDDPVKRPPGTQSVEYALDCTTRTQHGS